MALIGANDFCIGENLRILLLKSDIIEVIRNGISGVCQDITRGKGVDGRRRRERQRFSLLRWFLIWQIQFECSQGWKLVRRKEDSDGNIKVLGLSLINVHCWEVWRLLNHSTRKEAEWTLSNTNWYTNVVTVLCYLKRYHNCVPHGYQIQLAILHFSFCAHLYKVCTNEQWSVVICVYENAVRRPTFRSRKKWDTYQGSILSNFQWRSGIISSSLGDNWRVE